MKTLFLLLATITMIAASARLQAQCDADFIYNATGTTQFHFESLQPLQGGYTYYHSWDFGDGQTSPAPVIDHSYAGGGNYNVCHTVRIEDATGTQICTSTECKLIQLIIIPPATPCIPHFWTWVLRDAVFDFRFNNNLSDFTHKSVYWSFGDGTVTLDTPVTRHTYAGYGTYYACFHVTDTIANCTDSMCVTVVVDSPTNNCVLSSSFSSHRLVYNTTDVYLQDLTYAPYQSTFWSFGDGTFSDTAVNIHHFPTFGIYEICLAHSDSLTGCADTACRPVTIDSCHTGMAAFDASYSWSGVLEMSYSASGLGDIHPYSTFWNFGDGGQFGTGVTATHNYNTPATYNVCFGVGVPGCGLISQCDSVGVYCHLQIGFNSGQVASNTLSFMPYGGNYPNMVYHWDFGDQTIGDEAYPIHSYAQAGSYSVCLVVFDTVTLCSDTVCSYVYSVLWNDTICGYAFVDANFDGIFDSGETPMQNLTIRCNDLNFKTDSTGYYYGVVPQWTTLNIHPLISGIVGFTLPFGSSEYNYSFLAPNQKQCGFNFGIITNSVSIEGKVYDDLNGNGVYDNNEPGIPNQVVSDGYQSVITTSGGNYTIVTSTGNYTLTKPTAALFAGFSAMPAQINLAATLPGGYYPNNNFGLNIGPGYSDVAVDLLPLNAVSTNRDPLYQMIVSNLSSVPHFYESSIQSDNLLSFDNQNYSATVNNALSHTTYWSDNLDGFEQKSMKVGYKLSPAAVMNQNVHNNAFISLGGTAEGNYGNNSDVVHQIIIAPWDPNNKIANLSGRGSRGFINGTEKLKFLINFQNTGTDYAINVIVKDVLDTDFDKQSLRFIASSHPCDVLITEDTLIFRFSKIMLPDSNTNEEESHGWLAYEILPEPHLTPGTQLHNTAAIYFDRNEPIITNTTLHTIDGVEGVPAIYADGELNITPNPFSTKTVITLQNMPDEDYSFAVTDVLGRKVMAGRIRLDQPQVLQRNELSSGTYFISFYAEGNLVKRGKLVVK